MSPQREHKIIVTPNATNPAPEFLLYLCARASPGWSSGAAEQEVKCHIYRRLLQVLADISQIFHLQEREKEKEKNLHSIFWQEEMRDEMRISNIS